MKVVNMKILAKIYVAHIWAPNGWLISQRNDGEHSELNYGPCVKKALLLNAVLAEKSSYV